MATTSTMLPLDEPSCMLGEGPWWDDVQHELYFVDIEGRAIHRLAATTGHVARFDTGIEPSFALLDTHGRIIAGLGDGIYAFDVETGGRRLIARPDMHAENRFNDAACDPLGRLWAGTMHVDAHRDRAPTGAALSSRRRPFCYVRDGRRHLERPRLEP